jgi:hypothetical protein
VFFAKYNYKDQVKEDEMGMTYNTHGGKDECIQGFWRKRQKERDQKEDLDVDGKRILKWILEK